MRQYVKRYRKGGFNVLLKKFHRGKPPKLTAEEQEALCEHLSEEIYLTTQAVCAYVKDNFNITYSTSGMTALLHRLNFVYKKPKLIPGEPDSGLQDAFLLEYERFMAKKPDDELLFFMDAVHPIHNTIASFGWIPKGSERCLRTNSARQRLNIHGAMNAETYETHVLVSEDNINQHSTIDLLLNLEKYYPDVKRIHVILDNARYHYSDAVKAALINSKIHLIFLPPYSPELNLIERLWHVFKKNILYNKFYKKFSDFKQACFGFFKNYQQYYDEVAAVMGDGLDALIIPE